METSQEHKTAKPRGPGNITILRLIALLKFFEGLLLVLATYGIISFIGTDLAGRMANLLLDLHMNIDTAFMRKLLSMLDFMDTRRLVTISASTAAYAALVLVEAVGLWLQQRWAEILTVVATGFFVPYEVIEIIRHAGIGKITLLGVNVAIVAYLVAVLVRKDKKTAR